MYPNLPDSADAAKLRSVSQRKVWCLKAIALAATVYLLVIFPLSLDFDGPAVDDPVYYLTGAKALAEGHGYRLVMHLNEPRITHYPPLQSLYLSLIWRLNPHSPENTRWLHGGMVILQAGCAILMYFWLLRMGVHGGWAWLFMLTVFTSPTWLTLGAFYFSEPLFLAVALVMLMVWSRPSIVRVELRWLITGIGFGVMFLIRPAALGLIAGFMVILLREFWQGRRLLSVCSALPIVMAVFGWHVWCAGEAGHAEETALRIHRLGMNGFLGAVGNNIAEYFSGVAAMDFFSVTMVRLPNISAVSRAGLSLPATGLYWGLAVVSVILVLHGTMARQPPIFKALRILVIAYLIEVIVYPWNMGGRALVVLLPLLLYWLLRGLEPWITGRRFSYPASVFLACGLVLNLGANCYLVASDSRGFRQFNAGGDWESIDTWISKNVPQGACVVASSTLPLIRFRDSKGRLFGEDDFPPAMDFLTVQPGSARRPQAEYLVADARRWGVLKLNAEKSDAKFSVIYPSPNGHYFVLRVERDIPQHQAR